MTAKGPATEVRGLACAGLRRGSAWALRRALDAARADVAGEERVLEIRYPPEAQGSWLLERGQRPPSGLCQGLIDWTPNDISLELGADRSSLNSFEGPFVAKSIAGLNVQHRQVHSPAECAQLCLETAGCASFDYGADGTVIGECWLNTANRTSAGSAFRTHRLFDYYERQEDALNVSTPATDAATKPTKGIIAPSALPEALPHLHAAVDGEEDRPQEDGGSEEGPMFLVFGAAFGGVLMFGILLGAMTILLVHIRKSGRRFQGARAPSELPRPVPEVSNLPPTVSLGSAAVPGTISIGSTSVVVVGQPVRDPMS